MPKINGNLKKKHSRSREIQKKYKLEITLAENYPRRERDSLC